MRLGLILIKRAGLSAAHLKQALERQRERGGRIGTVLIEEELVSIEDVSRGLAEQHHLPEATTARLNESTEEICKLFAADDCAKHMVVPFACESRIVSMAMRDPRNYQPVDQWVAQIGLGLSRFVCPELRLHYYLERLYRVKRPERFRRERDPNSLRAPGSDRRSYRPPSHDFLAINTPLGLKNKGDDGIDLAQYTLPSAKRRDQQVEPAALDQIEIPAGPAHFASTPMAPKPKALPTVSLRSIEIEAWVSFGSPLPDGAAPIASAPPQPGSSLSATATGSSSLADNWVSFAAAAQPSAPTAQQNAAQPTKNAKPQPSAKPAHTNTIHHASLADAATARSPQPTKTERKILPSRPKTPDEDQKRLATAAHKLSQINSQQQLTAHLAAPLLQDAGCTILFSRTKDLAVALGAHGTKLSPAQIKKLAAPLITPSLLQRACVFNKAVCDKAKTDAVVQFIATYLEQPIPLEALVVPFGNLSSGAWLLCLLSRPERGFPLDILRALHPTVQAIARTATRLARQAS